MVSPITSPAAVKTSSFDTSWSDKLTPYKIKDFCGDVGPTVPIPKTPLEIFQLFFTPECLKHIVVESNRYAKEVMTAEQYDTWIPLDVADVKAFFGFHILMGLNKLPSVDDYWKQSPIYHYSPIADKISRNRYREIIRYLHFADNSKLAPRGSEGYDRLGKIRPLLELIQSRCAAIYKPSKHLAIDEAMIKFQGRSSLKQYMPQKPIKRGIKVWVLADSSNGYFSRLEVYTGHKDRVEHGLGARVVKDLSHDFHGKWHHLYFDNYFTSKQLLCDLESVGTYGCGTARRDRLGFPKELKNLKFKQR